MYSILFILYRKKFRIVGAFVLITIGLLNYIYYDRYSTIRREVNSVSEDLDIAIARTADNDVQSLLQTLSSMLNGQSDMHSYKVTTPCKTTVWPACNPDVCFKHLSLDLKERLWDILSPRLALTDVERGHIVDLSTAIPQSDVIFISATSDNHYNETQSMVHSLHTVVFPRVRNMKFVLFDIGLKEEQRVKTAAACNCHLIRFPFEKFPKYFREYGCYTWKPLIIMAAMLKSRIVVYQDASITWNDTVVKLLERTERLEVQLYGSQYMHNIPVATLIGTFHYMGDLPCSYLNYTQIQTGVMAFKRSSFITRTILEPWAKCGFERNCFCPNTRPSHKSCASPNKTLHMCHRYDQSALSLIVTKLFASQRYKFHIPNQFFKVNRRQKYPTYFDEIIAGKKIENKTFI